MGKEGKKRENNMVNCWYMVPIKFPNKTRPFVYVTGVAVIHLKSYFTIQKTDF